MVTGVAALGAVLWACTAMFAVLAYFMVIGVGGWWNVLGTVVALMVASVALGYHHYQTARRTGDE